MTIFRTQKINEVQYLLTNHYFPHYNQVIKMFILVCEITYLIFGLPTRIFLECSVECLVQASH